MLSCSWAWSPLGVAHHGAAIPLGAVPVSTRARLAGLVLAGLRVVYLWSRGGCSCGVVGALLSWPPHGRLGSVGSVVLLQAVLSSNPARVASTFVSVSVSCVLVCASVMWCSL